MKQRLFNSLMVGAIFVVLGNFIPQIFLTYLDPTQYYSVSSVLLDKEEYRAGEEMEVTLVRNSLIDASASVVRELVLLQVVEDNTIYDEVFREVTATALDKGSKTVITHFTLPAELEEGKYIWQATISYKVYDREKVTSFTTPIFRVI